MLCRDSYKLVAFDEEPEKAAELLPIIDSQVDRAETVRIWEDYRRNNFAPFRRQTNNGPYHDDSYGLAEEPSLDYRELMNNTFTGWTEEDEGSVTNLVKKT